MYLIQEYEPFTFPMGTYAALARGVLRVSALRAVLERAAARLLPRATGSASTPAAPPRATQASASFRERDHRGAAGLGRASCAGRHAAGCCSTPARSRTPPATCSSSGCSRCPGALDEGLFADGWELNGDRHGRAGRRRIALGRHVAAAAAARRPGVLRRAAARPRRRAGADVHAASEPRPDRDGLGRDADRHQRFENKTPEAMAAISRTCGPCRRPSAASSAG